VSVSNLFRSVKGSHWLLEIVDMWLLLLEVLLDWSRVLLFITLILLVNKLVVILLGDNIRLRIIV